LEIAPAKIYAADSETAGCQSTTLAETEIIFAASASTNNPKGRKE
jgi:hypothetical protein